MPMDGTTHTPIDAKIAALLEGLEADSVIVVVTNASGFIEHANQKFLAATGFPQEEIIGRSLECFGELEPEKRQGLLAHLRDGTEWRGGFKIRKEGGDHFWMEAAVFPIQGKDGLLSHFVTVAEDIGERKRTEESQDYAERPGGVWSDP